MPSAFDRTTPPSEHNPLQNLLDYDPSKIPLNIATLLDTWIDSIQEFIFPIVLELTGIDLSTPEHFFASIALLILNGGTAVMDFVNSIVSFIVDALTGITGGGLPDLTAWAADIPILSDIVEAITGVVGGGLPDVTAWAEDIASAVSGAVTGLADLVSNLLSAPATVLGDIPQSLVTGLTGALGTLTSNLAALISNLLSAPATVLGALPQTLVSGLSGALGVLTSGLSSVNGLVQDVIDAIISALRGIPFVGGGLADIVSNLTGFRETTETSTVNLGNFTISALASTARNPLCYCRYPVGDVTFPEYMHFTLPMAGITEGASAGTAHTHLLDPAHAVGGLVLNQVAQNCSSGGYLAISNTGVYDTVGMVVGKQAGSVNNIFVEVFREDELGGASRVFSGDVSSQLLTAADSYYCELAITGGLVCIAGEKYLIRLRNSSSTAVLLGLPCIFQQNYAPDCAMNTTTATNTNKTTITASEAAAFKAATLNLPWGLLASVNIAEPDVSYSDDANRANLGPWWVTSGGGGDITITGEKFSYGGTTDGAQFGFYIRRTSGDASLVSADLHVDPAATIVQRFGLLHSCNRELTQYVYLAVTAVDARIYSFAGGSLTLQATVAVGGTGNYSIYYDVPNDKYVALKDGAAIGTGLEWTGVSTAVVHNLDHRFGGMRISRDSGVNAGQIDNWVLRDYA